MRSRLLAGVLLLAVLAPSPRARTAGDPRQPRAEAESCSVPRDPSILLEAMLEAAGRLQAGSLDVEAVRDGVRTIQALERETAALCARLEVLQAELRIRYERELLWGQIAESYSEQAEQYRQAWKDALGQSPRRTSLVSCLAGAGAGVDLLGEQAAATVGLFCGFTLWP